MTETLASELIPLPRAAASELALALFDATAEAHKLGARARTLLWLAAEAAQRAGQLADARGERLGRDMVLAARLPHLDAEQQAIVAGVVALQREKPRPNRESVLVWLGEKGQRSALALAAIVRLARGLAGLPASLFVAAEGDATVLLAGGEAPAQALAAAEQAAGLWRDAIGPLVARLADAASPADARSPAAPAPLWLAAERDGILAAIRPLNADLGAEPVAESSRRALRRFFDKLLAREEAVLKDEDPEDVHQMRVATRRLRAALQTLAGVYEPDLIRRYRKGLRRIAQSLGVVRDADVFLEHLDAQSAALGPLLAAVRAERAHARAALLADLESRRYRKFKREFAEFLSTPGAGVLPPPEPGVNQRVRDFAGSAIWRRYELWRAYEGALHGASDETLHQARIAGKRFRYTLEFFAEPLGPRVEQVLEPLIALQECLGSLQDIVTARAHVAALGLAGEPGAQAYLAERAADRTALLAELSRLWDKVDSATYRRHLFELIVKV